MGTALLLGTHLIPETSELPAVRSKLTFFGYEGILETLEFDPAGKVLASVGYDGVVRLWDVVSGVEIGHQRLNEGGCLSACFSSDGMALVTGGREEIAFWDVSKDDAPTKRWPSDVIRQIKLSSDGKFLLTADRAKDVRLWNTAQHLVMETFATSSLGCTRLRFTPDGICWASIDGDTRVHVWRKQWDSPPTEYVLPGSRYSALTFSEEAGQLFARSELGYIQSLDITNCTPGRRFHVEGWVTSIELSPNGRLLAYGLLDGTVALLDTATGRVLSFRREHFQGIAALAFSRDSRLLASGGNDSTIKIWDIPELPTDPIHVSFQNY